MELRRKKFGQLHFRQKVFKNMKNILSLNLIISAFLLVSSAQSVSAQTPSPVKSASPTVNETLNEKLNTQINELKDKIASRVTELKLVEKRGVVGTVSETSTNRVTLIDTQGKTKLIDIDEITKFSSSASKTFGLSDLTKGTKVTVLGLYNKESKRILARFISTSVNPVFLTGGISEIDARNFVITVSSADGKKTRVDIGTTTRISSTDTDGELLRIGFAKLIVSDRVIVTGYPDKTDPELLVAQRLVVLSELPKDPKINIITPTPTAIPTTPVRRVTQAPAVVTPVNRLPSPTVAR